MKTQVKSPLPDVKGVGASRQWLPPGDWPTVLDYLLFRHPKVGAGAWVSRMAKGEVVDEQGRKIDPQSAYCPGRCVFYYREPSAEVPIPFAEKILYRDEHLLAVDKPHFLPVMPAGRFSRETLLARLKQSQNLEHLVPLHRLDRETAGVVLFSIERTTRGAYATLFMRREVRKVYEALAPVATNINFPLTRRSRIVAGEPFFRMKEVAGPANSETTIESISEAGGATLYRAIPLTGKKHQLRVHFSALGLPLVNDRLYPTLRSDAGNDYTRPLKLLAKSIALTDPLTGREHFFASERNLS